VANLLTFDVIERLYRKDWGVPVWEELPESFDDTHSIQNATLTYLGRLMPLSRSILLSPDGQSLTLANGLDYPKAPTDFSAEPTASLVRRDGKKEIEPPHINELHVVFGMFKDFLPSRLVTKHDGSGSVLVGAGNRALWRELPSLVVQRKAGEPGGPLVLSQLKNSSTFDIWVGAVVTDPKKPQDILDTVEGVYSIPAKMLHEEGRRAYEAEVEYAEKEVSVALAKGCKTYREFLETHSDKEIKMSYEACLRSPTKGKGYPEARSALRHYWNAVEQLLPLLNASIAAEDGSDDQQEKRRQWRSALWKAARAAYQAACAFETPRQRRAYPLGLRSLQFIQRKNDVPTTPATQAA
jgi:CRISPR system Cascade subunit CasA